MVSNARNVAKQVSFAIQVSYTAAIDGNSEIDTDVSNHRDVLKSSVFLSLRSSRERTFGMHRSIKMDG